MNNKGKIILIPTSGLANRMRIMMVALRLANETGKKLIIYWYKNPELEAHFGDLFNGIENVRIRKIPIRYKAWIIMTRFSSKLLSIENWYLRLFNFDFIFLDSMAEDVWKNRLNLPKAVAGSRNVFICSCQEINHFNVLDYLLFKPVANIQNKIDGLVMQFKPGVIGIHIRATDNTESIKNSPFHLFLEKIEEELKINKGASFFLATDNKNYQDTLVEKFGADRILFYEKEFRRELNQGIKDAVVDLYCLSKTSKIYGSYFSSFSEVAGRIGQIPVQSVKKETGA